MNTWHTIHIWTVKKWNYSPQPISNCYRCWRPLFPALLCKGKKQGHVSAQVGVVCSDRLTAAAVVLQVTALQIASLKKVNKRSQILLLDKNGSTSKVIAKELARKGFKKIRVVQVLLLASSCISLHLHASPCLSMHLPACPCISLLSAVC